MKIIANFFKRLRLHYDLKALDGLFNHEALLIKRRCPPRRISAVRRLIMIKLLKYEELSKK